MGQMCSLLIQKQSTEPKACAVYESGQSWFGRGTQATLYPILHGKWRQVTSNQDPEQDGHLSTRRAMSLTSRTHRGSGEGGK